jgi:hypothetical protein
MALFRRQVPDPADTAQREEWAALRAAGFDAIRPLLIPTIRETPAEEQTLTKPLGSGLSAVLSVRVEHGSFTVLRSVAAEWGVDDAELWAIALHNLRREPYEVHQQASERPVYLLYGTSQYTSAYLLLLHELVRDPTPHGMLVIAPSHTTLGFWVIPDKSVVPALDVIGKLGRDLWEKAQANGGGFTPTLFWWADGQLDEVALKEEGNSVVVTSSERFRTMLYRFAQ